MEHDLQTDDRRRHMRIPYRMQVRITTKGGRVVEGSTRDLSLHGTFFETTEPLDVGTECNVHLVLGDPHEGIRVELQGVVVRKAEGGVGVEFDEVAKSAFAFLRRMIPVRPTT